ncbi:MULTISPECIES: M23 family metallopeptidase [Anoxybacillaceae]|uniref:M23 family metallopeptidase n=1 Tax=Anoxybacteroides rupiense TaxID=311460 RepID=A0ABD5J0N4_9BACL|nr:MULTISPECIES: M23 family metallopeptidase [Anoxybacillus]MBB3906036.1 hypothetical protein [Anoxybacillus rupiensis]MED5053668.1 M23 family metallopeptidase [Anoxybacillus rupiensis]OQM44526.1 hypothetical protein B6A27_16125 [Anoxybacillus sp. UARK-01]
MKKAFFKKILALSLVSILGLTLFPSYERPVKADDFTCQPYKMPTQGTISSYYGWRNGSFHHGIDIAKSGDVPVYAAYAGIVSRAYYSSSYGNVVFIKHRGGTAETVYAHLKSFSVKAGDAVSPGQQIGYMGDTGDADGQHLHFEIHNPEWNSSKSNSTDPIPLLPDETTSPICWDGDLMKKGQIGRITVLKPINLWKRDANDKLTFVRVLNPGEVYRVYGYDDLYGGQYNVGSDHWITKMDGYIKYETPSKWRLDELKRIYP